MSVSGVNDWLTRSRTAVNAIIDLWVKDLSGLCDLTESYDVLGWELKRDKLLDAANEEVKQRLITNVNLERLPKAVSLLTSWRRLLKGVNVDGSWTRAPVEVLTRASTVASHAALTAEFTHLAKQILVELPNQVNNMRRKKAASDLIDKVSSSTVHIGEDLQKRLKQIADGTWPEKSKDEEGAGEAGEAGDGDGDDDAQPPRKKQRQSTQK